MAKRKSLLDSVEEDNVELVNDNPLDRSDESMENAESDLTGEEKQENLDNASLEKPEFVAEQELDVAPESDIFDNKAGGVDGADTIPGGPVVPDVQLQVLQKNAIAHGPLEAQVQQLPYDAGLQTDARAEEGGLKEVEVEGGRFVNFVLDAGPNIGEVRPALVTRAFEGETGELLNLLVFCDTDEETRVNDRIGQILWRGSVSQGSRETVGVWF